MSEQRTDDIPDQHAGLEDEAHEGESDPDVEVLGADGGAPREGQGSAIREDIDAEPPAHQPHEDTVERKPCGVHGRESLSAEHRDVNAEMPRGARRLEQDRHGESDTHDLLHFLLGIKRGRSRLGVRLDDFPHLERDLD